MGERIALIGAGPSGLAILRAFEAARASGRDIPEIVCFEKQADWGGQWNFTWRTGMDGHGEPVHSSMYRHLWSNGPKEALEFADYSFDEHFGRPIASYPPREVLWDYIAGRVERSDVRRFVRFEHAVRWVEEINDGAAFRVSVDDLATSTTTTEVFDRVIVASGHFSYPNVPEFSGISRFTGTVMHAHDFRGAESLRDRDVLLIGASYSAEDIGMQAFKLGARSVTLSYRTAPIGIDWPDSVSERPLVTDFDGRTAHFRDGTTGEFDAVIFCTGYLHKYPYLPEHLALDSGNNLYPDGLYRGVLNQRNPRLSYIGAQDQWFTFNMFDAQAWFVRDTILGDLPIPNEAERAADIARWRERFAGLGGDETQVRFQADYIRDLIEQTDYPMFDLEEVVQIFLHWHEEKEHNITGYRDVPYRSVMTGTMAAVHHTPWLDELDDSLERYLSPGDAVGAER